MKARKILAVTLSTLMVGTSFVGCGSNDAGKTVEATPAATEKASTDAEKPSTDLSGEITVLTNRTDLVDTTFVDYAKKFNETYPDVTVKYESMTDYEGDIQVRMSTTEYGDVLLMPTMDAEQYPDFFLPLGKQEELEKTYRTLVKPSYDGTTYGIPVFYVTAGIVYNKKVFEEAGIAEVPTTQEDFLGALQHIKDKTEAIPYYTNYAAGWTMNQWEDLRLGVSGDPEFITKTTDKEAPFTAGEPHYEIYKLMYDIVKNGLVEEDPVTSDWEQSKQMLADGKIGAMVLGAWSISQIKALAQNPDDIGYMPFPQVAQDGKLYASVQPDYAMAVNKNSKNPEAAEAYLWWFINESGFAESQGSIPQKLDSPMPATLSSFEDAGVTFISEKQPPVEKQGLLDRIDNAGQLGFYQPDFKLRIIDAALGSTNETYDEIMADLNQKWQEGKKEVAAQ